MFPLWSYLLSLIESKAMSTFAMKQAAIDEKRTATIMM